MNPTGWKSQNHRVSWKDTLQLKWHFSLQVTGRNSEETNRLKIMLMAFCLINALALLKCCNFLVDNAIYWKWLCEKKKKSKLNPNNLHSDQFYYLVIKETVFQMPIKSLPQKENEKTETFSIRKNNPFHISGCNHVSCLLLLSELIASCSLGTHLSKPSFQGFSQAELKQ